jgi:hypothetical protein
VKKLIARTAKLHSEPQKKSRRFKGIAITYEHIPTDLEERNHGSVYAVININTANPEAEEVAELIIDTLSGEFYQNLHEPALSSFESALTKINEELADITQQGYINWLNNLNAIIGVLSNNVLHISQAGKTEAYLYRADKSSHISDDLAGDAVNPLRTFINIASGELHEGDKVAIVTPSVFFHISKDELRKYVQEFQPKVAISHVADLLEGTTTEMNPNAALIIEAVTPEVAANETLDDQPDEIWVSEPSKPVENMVDTAAPIAKRIFQLLAAGWTIASAFISEKIIPLVKTKAGNIRPKASKTRGSVSGSLVETDELLSVEENRKESTNEEGGIITAPKLKTKDIYIKEERVKPKWLKLERVNFSYLKKYSQKIQGFSGKYAKNRKNFLIAGIVLFVLVSAGIYITWQNKNGTQNLKLSEAALTEAESKYDIGQNEISGGNKTAGISTLNSAKQITEKYTSNNKLKDRANNLLSKINSALDSAENLTRPKNTQIADAANIVGNNAYGPFQVGNLFYLVSKENGSIAEIDSGSGEVANALDKPEITGKISGVTLVSSRKVIVYVTDSEIYEFDTKDKKLTKQNLAEELESSIAVASYLTNIYTLASDGKVYKHTKSSSGYSKKIAYITDGNYVSNPIDIKIDSNVYVLSADGSITKYLSGKKQTFGLSDAPMTIENPKSLLANEDLKDLYLISGNDRIITFDDKGKFVAQYADDSVKNINGILADETGKAFYLTSNGKLLKFTY